MTSDTQTTSAAAAVRLQARPGVQLFVVSADELQVAAVNHSTTFTSVPVVNLVRAAFEALADAPTHDQLIELVAARTGDSPALVRYVVNMIVETGCMVVRSDLDAGPLGPLGEFYASVGADPDTSVSRLAAARPVAIAPSASAALLGQALADIGVDDQVLAVDPGSTCGAALERVGAALDAGAGPIVVWDVPWRMPFARLLNELAIARERPILFGVCEGMIARIGPYVLPGSTACLECLQARLLAHAGPNELRLAVSYRARHSDEVPAPLPAHPGFRRAMAGLLAVELSQILLSRPPTTLGGYVEYVFADVGARRHPALRSPRCPACHPERPQRLAWNARFPAPLVKAGGS